MALQKKNDRELAFEELQLEKKRHPVNSPLPFISTSSFPKPRSFKLPQAPVVEDTSVPASGFGGFEKGALRTIAKPCLRSVAAPLNPLNERTVEDGFRFQGQKLGIRAS